MGCVLSAQDSDDLAIQCTVVCKDVETAEDAHKLVDGCLVVCKYFLKNQKDLPKDFPAREALDLVRKVKVMSDGTVTTASVAIPSSLLSKTIRSIIPRKSPY